MPPDPTTSRHAGILVIGNGMVGHRFVESAIGAELAERTGIVVLGEEPRRAYDRVHLSSVFDGTADEELTLGSPDCYARPGVELLLGERAIALDPMAKTVETSSGRQVTYDACVLAMGSYPFVPPIPGTDAAGVFVYRTLEDLSAIKAHAASSRLGVVVGGGLLGLEAANALRLLGLDTTVVEFAPRLMAVQLDDGGGRALRRRVEELGITVRTSAAATGVRTAADGVVTGLLFEDDAIDA